MKDDHETFHQLAPLYALGGLSAAEKATFEQHMEACEGCGEEFRNYQEIAATVGASAAATPPAHLRDKLMERVRRTPRIPGTVLLEAGILVSRPEELPWRTLSPGIEFKLLYRDKDRSYNTCLVRMDSGSRLPRHRHVETEEIFLLSGDLHLGDGVMYAGDYCRADAQSIHGETFTTGGCLFLQMGSSCDEILR